MQPSAPENLRQRLVGARGWLIPAALLALAPKCFLCLIAYAGLGVTLGFSVPEICGPSVDPDGHYAIWLLTSETIIILVTLRRVGRSQT